MDLKQEIEKQIKELEEKWNKGQQLFVQLNQQIGIVKDELIAVKAQYGALSKLVQKYPDLLPQPELTTVKKGKK